MKYLTLSFMSLVFGASLITGGGIFSLPGDVAAQTHENLKNTIQNQGNHTRGVVRDRDRGNKAEFTIQHDMIKDDIGDVKALVEALVYSPVCGAGTLGQRFVVSGSEVCDNTTGFYWQQSPSTNIFDWDGAIAHCTALGSGYALAEVKQLISLADYSVANPGPILPAGHPFSNVQPAFYWSATEQAGFTTVAWALNFSGGDVFSGGPKSSVSNHALCVR